MVYLSKKKYSINNFYKSPIKNKKYRVALVHKITGKIKLIDFGSATYAHFRDTTPVKLYKHLDHGDKERRRRYKARHKGFIKSGYYSPGYFSMRFLWN
jgi:hypothetical protein